MNTKKERKKGKMDRRTERSREGVFPGGPVVRTPLSLSKAWVHTLVRELRSHKPCSVAKKNFV